MLASQAGIRPTEPRVGDLRATATATPPGTSTASPPGLESMVVGEAEIQGQVKRAYEAALAKETVGPLTNRLFKAALATGKRVRTETAIGERQLSLPARRGRARPRAARDAHRPRGRDRRHRRDERADRAGAGRQRRQDGVRRQPPARPGDRRSPGATSGRSVSFDELPQALEQRRHRRRRDRVAARAARGARAVRGDGGPRRPAAAADRPGRPARHRPRRARRSPACRCTTSTTSRP